MHSWQCSFTVYPSLSGVTRIQESQLVLIWGAGPFGHRSWWNPFCDSLQGFWSNTTTWPWAHNMARCDRWTSLQWSGFPPIPQFCRICYQKYSPVFESNVAFGGWILSTVFPCSCWYSYIQLNMHLSTGRANCLFCSIEFQQLVYTQWNTFSNPVETNHTCQHFHGKWEEVCVCRA
jgi:hypothetical protein